MAGSVSALVSIGFSRAKQRSERMRASYKSVMTRRPSLFAMALLVASCGIDQGGYHPPDVIGSPSAQTVLVSGPIDAFGSVHVNGLVLDTSRAQVRIDGHAASEAD